MITRQAGLCGAVALALSLCVTAQNPDRGYDVSRRLDQAAFGAFSMDAYISGQQTVLYTGDFRNGNTVWKIENGGTPQVVASNFGSGSLSIGDLVVDRQRHLVYVHDASHGAIYEIDPVANPVAIRTLATRAEWVTAFGNGGIDLNPVDGKLYLLTPGNSPTGGGLYSIELQSGTYLVNVEIPNLAAQFQAMGQDVRPDVIRFDQRGALWGSARDHGDLTNRPSILFRIMPPFTATTSIETVMVDPNVGTIADIECDPMTRDLFLAATERRAILRFNTDWYDHDRTLSVIEVVNSFNRRVQGIALGPDWGLRDGHSLFVALSDTSHFQRNPTPADLYEVGPFFVTDDVLGKRVPVRDDKVAKMRGVLPGMLSFSLAPDPENDSLFVLGKTNETLDFLPGIYRLDAKSFNQYFTQDFRGVATGFGSGNCGRGDLVFSKWLYVDPIDAYPQPMGNDVFRVYVRDEQDGFVHEVDPDRSMTDMPPCVQFRPEPQDIGARYFNQPDRGAMAIGPDEALWVFDKDPSTGELEAKRLFRANWTGKTLVQVEAIGPSDLNSNTASGFWRITHNLGTPADRGSSIVEVRFDFRGSSNPLHANTVFDTDQTGMADYFDAGNNTVVNCRGTYRNHSDVETGLVYDNLNTRPLTPCAAAANTGWTGYANQGSGRYRGLRFRFRPGEFSNETFEFDCDTDWGPGDSGADMAGMVVTVTLRDGTVFSGELIEDPANPERSFVRFTQQVMLDDYTPAAPVVLDRAEEIDGAKVSWLGDIYLLVVDKNAPLSKLTRFDPVHGTLSVLHTIPERVNDFTFYEVLDTGPIQNLEVGVRYFLFGTNDGKVLKWDPNSNRQTVLAEGFRFAVTTLEFAAPWHGAGPSSLFVMTGADNPKLGEIFELGPTDRRGEFVEPQGRVSLMPQGTRAAGNFVPFLRVEGHPEPGYFRDYVVKWVDPDGFGLGGAAGTMVLLIGGPTDYPGDIYIPGLYVPLSTFPVGVLSAFAHDPTGASTTPGAGEARFRVKAPIGTAGDFTLQAVVLDLSIGGSLGNQWTLSNGLRLVF